jgi:valyl-tRNA synthetase
MVSRLQELIKDTTRLIDEFRFSEAGNNTYDFFWSIFCDWYLEISKGEHKNPAVLLYALKTLLKLLHPFMPFVTEQIWSTLDEKKMLILEEWPKFDKSLMFKKEEDLMQNVISAISEIRSTRADLHINNSVKIPVTIYAGTKTAIFKEKAEIIKRMAQIGELNIEKTGKPIPSSVRIFLSGIEIYISLTGIINVQEERARIEKDIKEKQGFLNTLESRLNNKGFIAKAPKEVIEKEKAQQKAITEMLKKLNLYKNALN